MSSDRLVSANDLRLTEGGSHSFLGNLSYRRTATTPPPCSKVVKYLHPRVDLAHGVYFCSGSSRYSFSGHIDSQECIQEREIGEFVRGSHPELYKKLGKMALKSDQLSDDSEEACGAIDGCCDSNCEGSPATISSLDGGVFLPAKEAEPMDTDCPCEPDDVPQAQERFLSGKPAVISFRDMTNMNKPPILSYRSTFIVSQACYSAVGRCRAVSAGMSFPRAVSSHSPTGHITASIVPATCDCGRGLGLVLEA